MRSGKKCIMRWAVFAALLFGFGIQTSVFAASKSGSGSAVGKSTQPTNLKGAPKDERGDRKISRMSKQPALSSESGTKPK
jgi:hypothetical protein